MRAEWALVLAISVIVLVGTLAEITPFSSLLAWNEAIKHSWESPSQRAPIPHAESLSLAGISSYIEGGDIEAMIANLKAKGVEVTMDEVDVVFGELAEASDMTPIELFEIAVGQGSYYSSFSQCSDTQSEGRAGRGAGGSQGDAQRGEAGGHQAAGGQGGAGGHSGGSGSGGSGSGFGRMTLKQFCAQLELETNASIKTLNNLGFIASSDMTIRAIADSAGAHPSEVRTALDPEGHDH